MNLIPDKTFDTGNYFCTWDTQHNVMYERLPLGSHISPRDAMNEDFLFGRDGILSSFDGVRGDLIVVLDDGWDVPYGTSDSRLFGSFEVNTERFPSLEGLDPIGRIKALSDRVKSLGYKGLGLWVPSQAPILVDGAVIERSFDEEREYWEERARWCDTADVLYWKVDWGKYQGDPAFCRMVTEAARKYAPGLKVEHCFVGQPLYFADKPDSDKTERDNAYLKAVLPVSDFLRTYDVIHEMKYSSTLNRTAICLLGARKINGECGVLNIEDIPALGAALGCSIGVMRHELEKNFEKLPQPFRPISETISALRWQRIAPPFPANICDVDVSDEWLRDAWIYRDWPKNLWPNPEEGKEYFNSAPAVISRNMPLPEVIAAGEKPFVVSSVHPENNALCVAILPRVFVGEPDYTPPAEISVKGKSAIAPVCIFGFFEKFTVSFDEPLEGRSVFAQNLLSDKAVEITDDVGICDGMLSISGSVARKIEEITDGDNAIPAMLIKIL